jgi:Smg protein
MDGGAELKCCAMEGMYIVSGGEIINATKDREVANSVKENVLDVLMYLFENYMEGGMDEGPEFPVDQEALASELAEAGFARGEISKAFSWLEGLSQARDQGTALLSAGHGGMRHYNPLERKKLDERCRGFLLQMETASVLSPITRELVLDRVMALEIEEMSLEQLKWVMWMVLFNQPGQEHAYNVLEDLVFEERQGHLH